MKNEIINKSEIPKIYDMDNYASTKWASLLMVAMKIPKSKAVKKEFRTHKEAIRCREGITVYITRHKLPLIVGQRKNDLFIYKK